ncbi:putative baseplate assembly protein [Nitrosomonas sp. HPC101]|uniref:putative baseplate assembly protein n=1 Tax=Nitrosomonas sp. HPC101 TaxID=1658667 RepID=UPI00136D1451|nr:putative baseplate assembly protein [Nitrosomonas sp. HPC101]MXS86151.1 putative baseplate assembly protein [Nitrosomonas sp. HPC101]
MKTNCCDCCYPAAVDQAACGCCEGIEIVTPLPTYNRPGLSQIGYRIGTHASFLETMTARLTGFYLEKQDVEGNTRKFYPLTGLTTRDTADPSLAFLDAWATVADVLTFYQERIANEGYLRTAAERRSIVELARLVGYRPRPGVAASVFLAYTIDANTQEEVVIPAGSRAQSIPGPGELPQPFETSEDLKARAQWNNLKPRVTQAQTKATIEGTSGTDSKIYLKGLSTDLKKNDALLIDFGEKEGDKDKILNFKHIKEVLLENKSDRTLVTFIKQPLTGFAVFPINIFFNKIIDQLVIPASIQPANKYQLKKSQGHSLAEQFALRSNATSKSADAFSNAIFHGVVSNIPRESVAQAGYSVLGAFSPVLKDRLATATARVKLTDKKIKVYAFRATASLFGHNAPKEPQYEPALIPGGEGHLQSNPKAGNLKPQPWPEWKVDLGADKDSINEGGDTLYLDRIYKEVSPGDYIAIQKTDAAGLEVYSIDTVQNISRSAYGITGETTKIKLRQGQTWWNPQSEEDIQKIRTTKVYVQPEELELAEEPITKPVCGGKEETIELNSFYSGLEAGRWVIVSGEREDVAGERFSELALLASVTHDIATELPDENLHTYVQFAEKLAYCFKRDTVTIYGNVVKATHGETRLEVLGSGNGAKALQTFELKQKPLTHVSAAKPSGIDSTLKVFVNHIEWHEADSLASLEANDRAFVTQTDNDDKTAVTFGNGREGARLPSGVENIRAQYRNGIGRAGNVRAEQISLLLTKPLGVKEVINPLRASGGADRETRDQARRHVPLAVKALDRLVSTQDCEDFSRVFAGVGKAYAIELNDGRLPLIHVTIAGVDDVPIDANSDLLRNLLRALYDFGDPFQKIQLAVRELLMIVIEAGIAILPDYQWESVVTEVRSALLDQFSFERRELGQDVFLSEILSAMQSVRGVAYVDVDAFGGIPEKISEEDGNRRLLTPNEISEAVDCLSTRWSAEDMETYCEDKTADAECDKYENCKNYGSFGKTVGVRQRLQVNLAGFENGAIRPAQLAFLSPDVPATLILNQIK